MNDHGLTVDNLMFSLPSVLDGSRNTRALALAVSSALVGRISEIDRLILYSRIDELPEQLLDILAYDFKVDWWDADYSLEEKRQTLKDSWNVHRTLGTKYAVEKGLSAIYPNTKIYEWWEYDGEPYHFIISLDVTSESVDADKHARVMNRVEFYKNLRSVLDSIEYAAGEDIACFAYAAETGIEMLDGATAL